APGRDLMTHRRGPLFARFGVLVVLVSVLGAACAGGGQSPGAATANPSTGGTAATGPLQAADRIDNFNFAITFWFTSLDSLRSVNAISDMNWLKPVYDSLLTIGLGRSGLELRPQLAKSYQVAPDGLSISFELRDDVNFQDGTHFNAAVVKANIARAK